MTEVKRLSLCEARSWHVELRTKQTGAYSKLLAIRSWVSMRIGYIGVCWILSSKLSKLSALIYNQDNAPKLIAYVVID